MTKIVATYACEDHIERQRECQSAINCEFVVLTRWAESAGWSWQEISLALTELVEQYVAATGASGIMESPQTNSVKPKTLH
jgi:hypothetical protein